MNINILGEHIEVTEAINKYIKDKFSTIHAPERLNSVDFRIGTNKQTQYINFHALCPHNDNIQISSKDSDLYKAIDKIMIQIHRRFIKHKEKHNSHLTK